MQPLTVCLPTEDRAIAYAFYGDGLGLETPGEPADDGVPEPLQVVLNEHTLLMLIPTGGFGWVIGGREVAAAPQTECLLSFDVASDAEVDEWVDRARGAGGQVVAEPTRQPWGYVGTVADPDGHLWQVTSGFAGR